MDSIRGLSLLALLSLPAAYAYDISSNGQYAAGDITSKGAFGLSSSSLAQLVAKPNLTASYPLAGYDLSIPAGQNPPLDTSYRWSLDIAVAANVALPDTKQTTQLTVLSLKAPSKDIQTVDPSWTACAWIWFGLTDGATAAAQGDNNGCSALSSTCISDLQSRAGSDLNRNNECNSLELPQSCTQFSGLSISFGLTQKILAGREIFAYISTPEEASASHAASYNTAGTNVWPMLLSFRHNSENSNQTVSHFACLRAHDVQPGSQTPSLTSTTTSSAPAATTSNGDRRFKKSLFEIVPMFLVITTYLLF